MIRRLVVVLVALVLGFVFTGCRNPASPSASPAGSAIPTFDGKPTITLGASDSSPYVSVTRSIRVTGFPPNTQAGLATCWSASENDLTISCPFSNTVTVDSNGTVEFGGRYSVNPPPGRPIYLQSIVVPNVTMSGRPPDIPAGQFPAGALAVAVPY